MDNLLLTIRKWFLLITLALFLGVFFYYDLNQYLNLATIRQYHLSAAIWTEHHYFYAVLLYIFVFSFLLACAIPCATILTLAGGFLFGVIGVVYAAIATTLGGLILFFAVRVAIGKGIAAKKTGFLKIMEKGFQKNAFNYLLILRLIPVAPCWISNVSAGALNVPVKTFVLATLLGIFPATFVYTMIGRGMDKVISGNETLHLGIILTPAIFWPLLALVLISLLPLLYKVYKRLKA